VPEGLSDYAELKREAAELLQGPPSRFVALTAPLPPLEIKTGAGQLVRPEDYGFACADPQTDKIAWLAYACDNVQCPGRGKDGHPYLFPFHFPGAKPGATTPDGRVTIHWPLRSPESLEKVVAHPQCPACGQDAATHVYDLPEVIQRRRQLERQLAISRAAYHHAKDRSEAPPAGLRLPIDVMNEIASLPRLYLLPNQPSRAESGSRR